MSMADLANIADIADMKFEAALAELESIVAKMESGSVVLAP